MTLRIYPEAIVWTSLWNVPLSVVALLQWPIFKNPNRYIWRLIIHCVIDSRNEILANQRRLINWTSPTDPSKMGTFQAQLKGNWAASKIFNGGKRFWKPDPPLKSTLKKCLLITISRIPLQPQTGWYRAAPPPRTLPIHGKSRPSNIPCTAFHTPFPAKWTALRSLFPYITELIRLYDPGPSPLNPVDGKSSCRRRA